MKIAIVSGKGGTGKTTVATNLANVVSKKSRIQLLDADVEEPNSHLFLDIEYLEREEVKLLIPQVDNEKCTRCGKCAESCQFGAISVFNTGVLVFDNLCHGCGLCKMVCPSGAISEKEKTIGSIKLGKINDNFSFGTGLLNIGEPSGVRIIRKLKKSIDKSKTVIIDAPPGTSCPVVETLRGIDYAVLVTEATPFGLHDLKLAVDLVNEMGIPSGIIVNRASSDYTEVEEYANSNSIPVLEKIPFDRDIAVAYSNGKLFTDIKPEWKERFEKVYKEIEEAYTCSK